MNAGMIERISWALMESDGQSRDWHHYSDIAFAIIREMREPTSAMARAADGLTGAAAWNAMIEIILREKG
jgi:hypothetical protein